MANLGRGNLVVGSGRVTRACARAEQLESPVLSVDDSPFNFAISSEDSTEVSVTDSEGVERVDDYAEVESEESEGVPPVREPEVGSGSGGNAPVTASVDLR